MKSKRTNTLMFQLVLCFSAILIGVLALLITSWSITRRETENSMAISMVTAPLTRLYADLDILRASVSGFTYQNLSHDDLADGLAAAEDMRDVSDALMRLLNENGYNRASIDLNYTTEAYLGIFNSIISSYFGQNYADVTSGIEELDGVEKWIRGYLAETNGVISQMQEDLQSKSARLRRQYYRVMLVLSSTIFVFCLLTLVVAAQRFVAPIQALCKAVKDFRLSDSIDELHERGIPCRPTSLKEIRTLATAIYSMQDAVLSQYVVEKQNERLSSKLQEEALRTAQMERQLQETQLKALQAQINPHFLFNTLNMIAQMSYIEEAPQTTELLETFSDYFRYNVESFERDVTLAEELSNVQGYISLQKARFGERIRYEIEADDAVRDIKVPCLIIQPLVENAISHGLRMKTCDGEVHVSVRANGEDGFEIEVADNGCGMDEVSIHRLLARMEDSERDEQSKHPSIGLTNVANRLRIAFGNRMTFRVKNRPGGGLNVTLRVEGRNAA